MNLEQPTRALLDLVEADRARRSAQILGDAQGRAATLLAQAHGDARARMRQAFAEQRQRRDERIAEAQARLATQRRLHEQQRSAALLHLAWQQLPAALLARWQQPAGRAAWVAHVLGAAQMRMPRSGWRVLHAPDWPAAEQQAFAAAVEAAGGVASSDAPRFVADPAIRAGLKVVAGGNLIDGTADGLLAERAAIEARLLRELEVSP